MSKNTYLEYIKHGYQMIFNFILYAVPLLVALVIYFKSHTQEDGKNKSENKNICVITQDLELSQKKNLV